MIKKNQFILFLFVFLISSIEKHSAFSNEIQMPQEDQKVHEIIDSTIQSIKNNYNLLPCGMGIEGKFNYLEISFETNKLLEKDDARQILTECVEEFLKKINTNEIRNYLKPYPFTHENVGIIIYINDENRSEPLHPKIALASASKGRIIYRTIDPKNTFSFKEKYEETYEQALDLVKKQLAQKTSDK